MSAYICRLAGCCFEGQALGAPDPGQCQALATCLLVVGCSLEGASWMGLQLVGMGGGGKERGNQNRRKGTKQICMERES